MRNLTLVFSNETAQTKNTRKALERLTSVGALIGGAILFFFLGGLTAKLAFGAVDDAKYERVLRKMEMRDYAENAKAGDGSNGNLLGEVTVNLRGRIRCANTTQTETAATTTNGNASSCKSLVFDEDGGNGRTYTLKNAEMASELIKKNVAVKGQLGANSEIAVTEIQAL